MDLPNRKPLPPEPPEDWVDLDLVKAFGVPKAEDEEPFGVFRRRTVVEIYPKQTEVVRTPFES